VTVHRFPEDFIWGVATSAFQIEGSTTEGGRGESIWDRFARTPGAIADGTDARVACDHYRRWRDDVALLEWLGVNAYRFSISWPRILPDGDGAVNPAGLGFYDALVDRLLAAGIQPFVTLYHWDLPQALQERGGWPSRSIVDAFIRYTDVVAERLGDRVRHWVTHNEPWCITSLGHESGSHAPGLRDPRAALRVAHHLLRSHGHAVDVLRTRVPDAEVGIVLNLTPGVPHTEHEADRDAARRFDGTFNRWYLDPLHGRGYPEDVVRDHVRRGTLADSSLPWLEPGDLDVIARPADFLGVNYYSRVVLRRGATGEPEGVRTVPESELTDMGWEVHPEGLHDLLVRLHHEYNPPAIAITENGAAYPERSRNGEPARDARRVAYLRDHLVSASRAIDAGVPLRAYFAWSLMDNFEWAEGFTKRFGLYEVDYDTQRRIARDSASWYRTVVAASAVTDGTPH